MNPIERVTRWLAGPTPEPPRHVTHRPACSTARCYFPGYHLAYDADKRPGWYCAGDYQTGVRRGWLTPPN